MIRNHLRRLHQDDEGAYMMSASMFAFVIITIVLGIATVVYGGANESRHAAIENRLSAATDTALADAALKFNTNNTAGSVPVVSGSGAMHDGSDTRWSWTAASIPGSGTTSNLKYKIEAKASHQVMRNQKVSTLARTKFAELVPLNVGKKMAGATLRYPVSPAMAFEHVLAGSNVVAVSHSAMSQTVPFVTGKVAVWDGSAEPRLNVRHKSGNAKATSVPPTFYANVNSIAGGSQAMTIPVPMMLDAKIVTNTLDTCSTRTQVWKASANGGVLPGGTTLCVSRFIVDAPLSASGTGAINIHAGTVDISAKVSATTNAPINLYAGGKVNFNVDIGATGGTHTVNSLFVYAPGSECRTLQGSTANKLVFKGSLACKEINVQGSFASAVTKGTLASVQPGGKIWFLDNKQ